MSMREPTRREALSAGVWVVGTLAALESMSPRAAHAGGGDVGVLNGLLNAEYDLQGVYRSTAGYLASPSSRDPDRANAAGIAAVLAGWAQHHALHADAVATAVRAAGGTPSPRPAGDPAPPTGFTASVSNYLRLIANRERAASIAYVDAQRTLATQANARVAAAIGGVETQHFVVAYTHSRGALSLRSMATMAGVVVPRAFVSRQGDTASSLGSVADFSFGS